MAELNLHWGARGEDNLCDVISIILPLPPSGFVKGFKTVASDRCVKPPPTSFGPECLDPIGCSDAMSLPAGSVL